MSDIPKEGSSQWKRNEKIINTNPALKQARDIKEGLDKPAHRYGDTHGSTGRFTTGPNSQAYKDNWDRIFGGDRKNVNHRDTDNEQE